MSESTSEHDRNRGRRHGRPVPRRRRRRTAFWENLAAGVESVPFFRREELAAAGVDPALLDDPAYVPARAALDGAELFDAGLFGYSPREAEIMDPQHRLLLECAWEALEHAGYDPGGIDGPDRRLRRRGDEHLPAVQPRPPTATLLAAGRRAPDHAGQRRRLPGHPLSYKLGLRGPSLTVQTACSTSLVAVHLAAQSLLNGECDMALAGGVRIRVPRPAGYLYQTDGILSPDGHCRPFDAAAQGPVDGEGAGARGAEAPGRRAGRRRPHPRGDPGHGDQQRRRRPGRLHRARRRGPGRRGGHGPGAWPGSHPESIGFVEAHGTARPWATRSRSPPCARSSTAAPRRRKGFCALGSVKGNVGHLDAAAGVTSLIKAVLALERGVIPPTPHFQQPNPRWAWRTARSSSTPRPSPGRPDRSPGAPGSARSASAARTPTWSWRRRRPVPPADPAAPAQLLVLSAAHRPGPGGDDRPPGGPPRPPPGAGPRRRGLHPPDRTAGAGAPADAGLPQRGRSPRGALLPRSPARSSPASWTKRPDREALARCPRRPRVPRVPGPALAGRGRGGLARPPRRRAAAARRPAHLSLPAPAVLDRLRWSELRDRSRRLPPPVPDRREAKPRAPGPAWHPLRAAAERPGASGSPAFSRTSSAIEPVGAFDRFFEIGGDSLLGLQLLSRVKSALGAEVRLEWLFQASTVADLAELIAPPRGGADRAPPTDAIPRVPPATRPPPLLRPGAALVPRPARPGDAHLQPDRVRAPAPAPSTCPPWPAALAEVVRRHESLRTVFVERPRPPRRSASCRPWTSRCRWWTSRACRRSARGRGRAARHAGRRAPVRPLAAAAPASPSCTAWPPDRHALAARLPPHRRGRLVERRAPAPDLAADLPRLRRRRALAPARAADPVRGLRELAARTGCARRRLGAPARRLARAARPAPARPRPAHGPAAARGPDLPRTQRASWSCRRSWRAPARAWARRRAPPCSWCCSRPSPSPLPLERPGRPVVGSPVAGRDRAELERLIGFFLNILAAARSASRASPTFRDLLGRVRETALAAYAHQDVPVERISRRCSPERDPRARPCSRCCSTSRLPRPGARRCRASPSRPWPLREVPARFDLTLSPSESERPDPRWIWSTTPTSSTAPRSRACLGPAPAAAGAGGGGAGRPRLPDLPADAGGARPSCPIRERRSGRRRTAARARALRRAGAARTPDAAGRDRGRRARGPTASWRSGRPARPPAARGRGPRSAGRRLRWSARRAGGLAPGVLKAGGAYVPLDPGIRPERRSWSCDPAHPERAPAAIAPSAEARRRRSSDRRPAEDASLPRAHRPPSPASRRRAGRPRLRRLHLRLHRATQGDRGHPWSARALLRLARGDLRPDGGRPLLRSLSGLSTTRCCGTSSRPLVARGHPVHPRSGRAGRARPPGDWLRHAAVTVCHLTPALGAGCWPDGGTPCRTCGCASSAAKC